MTVIYPAWLSAKYARCADGGNLTFFVEDNFAFVQFFHLIGVNSSVANVAGDGTILLTLVRNGFKKRGASRSRATEDEAHFAGFQNTR